MRASSLGGDGEAGGHVASEGLLTAPVAALSGDGLVVVSCRASVLRPSRFRPILRYVATCFDQRRNARVQRVVIGKGYYRGNGATTFDTMRQLWSDGFAEDRLLTIPEPVAYLPELSLLLQGRAPGKALYLGLDDPAAALKPVRLAGRWLAKLHAASVASAVVLQPEHDKEKLGTYRDVLARVCPPFAPRIQSLTGRILSSLKTLPEDQVVCTHGDFQPKNIYIRGNQVTVIDFDRFALAHPARDLGHFIGQSMTMSYVRTGSFKEVRAWNSAFLDEYVRVASTWALPALPFFIARTFLEVLYYKLFVRPVKDPSFLPAWLDECERWLDGVREFGSQTW